MTGTYVHIDAHCTYFTNNILHRKMFTHMKFVELFVLDEVQRELRSHKREAGLIPFPRIGRRSGSRNPALWFGPRLGRSVIVPENYDTSYIDAAGKTYYKYLIFVSK